MLDLACSSPANKPQNQSRSEHLIGARCFADVREGLTLLANEVRGKWSIWVSPIYGGLNDRIWETCCDAAVLLRRVRMDAAPAKAENPKSGKSRIGPFR